MALVAFTPIVGTLCYLWDRDSDRVLLVRRDARPDDDHFGKVNGLGGKLEVGEHVVAGMRRELHEEAGIEVTSLKLRGTITWTDFGPRDENWLGFVFLADAWQGDPPESNEEGNLIWVPRSLLLAACDPRPRDTPGHRPGALGRRPSLPAARVRRRPPPVPR